MKSSKSKIHRSFYKIPEIKSEDFGSRSLTSFSGLIIFQKLFQKIKLSNSLKKCFIQDSSSVYPLHWITRCLIVHFLLGYRRLRDIDYYRSDPMVERVLGVTKLPDTSTISRQLKKVDNESINSVRELNTEMILNRVQTEGFCRLTFDFDGSVLSTKRKAEGTAVGFNKIFKGRRSYYPLFCTLSQTAQFFDMHHRPGNVHDSNGAEEFVTSCLYKAREAVPGVALETRMDGAFFQELLMDTLHSWDVEFSVSVPFYRFPELKKMVEGRKRWKNKADYSFFESDWSPGSWAQDFRIIIVRTEQVEQRKGPLQFDLFEPYDWDYSYQVIMTNKKQSAKKVIEFHRGRGSQEKIFAQAKTQMNMDNIPVRSLNGNKLYCMASLLAHNLNHELQMDQQQRDRGTTENRACSWSFEGIRSLRQRLIQRAGRLIRPQNRLTLIIGANEKIRDEISELLSA